MSNDKRTKESMSNVQSIGDYFLVFTACILTSKGLNVPRVTKLVLGSVT
jgi:hypothetical protein